MDVLVARQIQPPALLELSDATVAVAGRRLLRGLEIELRPLEIVALVGPSGSGKSSLLRAIAGLDDFATGRCRLEGRTPGELGWPSWRRRVCYLPQRAPMLDGTVAVNLRRAFDYATAEHDYDSAIAAEWLERLGLASDMLDQKASTLSEGERQRVGLARSLLVTPRVLLLDEPTSALDPAATEQLERAVRLYLGEADAAALVVTHDHAQAERLADRTLELAPHRVADEEVA
jgi:ABC-type iron transport system FetAB ATPase subunit